MDTYTIHRLNDINRVFYERTATHFDATRQRPWAGWSRLQPYIPARRPLRVLDVGCGNGRFGRWLRETTTGPLAYHGVDNSPDLLGYAQEALGNEDAVTLSQVDIVTGNLPVGVYDLVVLFGVIHHIPGAVNRLSLMRALGGRVADGGTLVVAAWRFWDNPRFREKAVAWEDGLTREPGDHLLDWQRGTVARRYCHHVDDTEQDALARATGLDEVERYRADGADGRTNSYSVFRK